MPKKCNNPTCDSNGELLDDEMFHRRSNSMALVGDCRRCVSIKGKAKRAAKRKLKAEQKNIVRTKVNKKSETEIFNEMNRRW